LIKQEDIIKLFILKVSFFFSKTKFNNKFNIEKRKKKEEEKGKKKKERKRKRKDF